MISIEEAKALVRAEISKENPYAADLKLEILDADTVEKEFSFVILVYGMKGQRGT